MTSLESREMTEQEMINTSTAPQMAHMIQVLRQIVRNKDKEIERWVDMVKQLQRDGELDPPEPKPLLADAKVGDLCQLRNGIYEQIERRESIDCVDYVVLHGCYYDLRGKAMNRAYGNIKDIISTEPLAPEGSAEWGRQCAKLGNKICHPKLRAMYCFWLGDKMWRSFGCQDPTAVGSDQDIQQYYPYGLETGWTLCEEPDHIAEDKKVEPEPEPAKEQFEVGDWVEHKESKEQATIRHIMNYGAIEIEFAYSTESDIYQTNDFHNDFRKLDPSEVVVNIGCLSGTVAHSSSSHFCLCAEDNWTMIAFDMLDAQTRSLVESLLKAQEEE